jgi:hypothetical protein
VEAVIIHHWVSLAAVEEVPVVLLVLLYIQAELVLIFQDLHNRAIQAGPLKMVVAVEVAGLEQLEL